MKSGSFNWKDALFLIRAFFPSWRLFEDSEGIPRLLFRTLGRGGIWSDWGEVILPERRRFSSLFLNAAGNLSLAFHSLVDLLSYEVGQLPEDPSAGEQIARSLSYVQIDRMVQSRVSERLGITSYQFKIVLESESSREDLLISPELGLKSD